LKITGKTAH